jgi:hypothetical protein
MLFSLLDGSVSLKNISKSVVTHCAVHKGVIITLVPTKGSL